jgi:uncharacterized RDD family membrane protein YckC
MDLQENLLTDIEVPQVEAPQGLKILSGIIDFVLEIGLLILLYIILPGEIRSYLIKTEAISTYLVTFAWITIYRIITIFAFQRTVGMIICRIKFLNEDLQPLSPGEKMTAVFIRSKKIKVYKA